MRLISLIKMNPLRQLTTRTSRKRILGPISTGGWDDQTLLRLSVASNQVECDEVDGFLELWDQHDPH